MIPLFNQHNFMRMLTGWYHRTITRDKATWAAILVVCAMGLRSPAPGENMNEETKEKSAWASYCMRNAQSVMSDLATREEDLLGVQVLLALVMMFHNSSDTRPAGVLIGTAMRLAHRLQLHSNDSARFFSPEDVLQRSRVFWIAYTLDKDIALRTKVSPLQLDNDIDIPLPSINTPDGAGIIWTSDGRTQFNVFRMRLDLSHIQGKIYDLLYSNRSLKVQGKERQRRVNSMQAMLTQWLNRIPMPFRIEHVATTVNEAELLQMVKLHHAYLHAVVHTHGIYSKDAEWMNRISSLSRASIEDYARTVQGPMVGTCSSDTQNPPLDEGWKYCVEISRGCMKLFQDATPTECMIW